VQTDAKATADNTTATGLNLPFIQNGLNQTAILYNVPQGSVTPPYTVDPVTNIKTFTGASAGSTDTAGYSNNIGRAFSAVFNADQFAVVLSALVSIWLAARQPVTLPLTTVHTTSISQSANTIQRA